MPRLPDILPSVVARPVGQPRFEAGGVEPVRDQRPAQTQALGRAMQETGGDLFTLGSKIQDDVDTARVHEMDALFSDSVRKTLQDPQGGFLTTVGKAAVDRRAETLDALAKARREFAGKLDNPVQREAFHRAALDQERSAASMVDRHTAHQAQVYRIGQAKATIGNRQQDAITYWNGGDSEDRLRARLLGQSVDDLADQLGLGKDDAQRVAMRREVSTGLHAGIVQSLVGRDRGTEAAAYFKSIPAGSIDPEVGAKLADLVQRADVDAKAQRWARGLDKLPGDIQTKIDFANDAFEKGDITEAVRERIESKLKSAQNLRDHERTRSQNLVIEEATLFATQNRSVVREFKFEDLRPEVQQRLTDSGARGKFELWLEQGNQWITTNRGYSLLRESPDALMRRYRTPDDLVSDARGDVNDSHLEQLTEKWHKARGDIRKASQLSVSEVGDKIRLLIDAAGLSPIRSGTRKALDSQDSAREAQETFRLEQAVIEEARGRGGANWMNSKVLEEAAERVFGTKIIDEAGKTRVRGAVSAVEMAKSSFKTAYGPVPFTDLENTPAAVEAMKRLQARGVAVTDFAIATEVGRMASESPAPPAAVARETPAYNSYDTDGPQSPPASDPMDDDINRKVRVPTREERDAELQRRMDDARARDAEPQRQAAEADAEQELRAQWKSARRQFKNDGEIMSVTIKGRTFFRDGRMVEGGR